MHVSFYQQQPSQEHHCFAASFLIGTFQLFHLRAIRATGDISIPGMNWKPPSSMPFSQQQYQSGAKSAGQENNSLYFEDHFILKTIFLLKIIIVSISSLQDGPRNWGYLRPQNEWEAGITITLLPTTLP
jgi:hypothetical protein